MISDKDMRQQLERLIEEFSRLDQDLANINQGLEIGTESARDANLAASLEKYQLNQYTIQATRHLNSNQLNLCCFKLQEARSHICQMMQFAYGPLARLVGMFLGLDTVCSLESLAEQFPKPEQEFTDTLLNELSEVPDRKIEPEDFNDTNLMSSQQKSP